MKRKNILVFIFGIIINCIIFLSETSRAYNLINDQYLSQMYSKIAWCMLVDILLLIFAWKADKIFDMPYEIIMNRGLVWNLSKNDFKVRYVGSYLGIFWAFVNPMVTILLYWIVFQFAFKSSGVGGHPYVLWLVSGLVPWFLIQDIITSGSNALLEYAYLVKKVVFKISVLPAIKVTSACFVHVVFMLVVAVVFLCFGYFPNLYTIQLGYYFICAVALSLGLIYATSAIILFVRDLGQFISVFMQVFMWATPILWNVDIVPKQFAWIVQLNPVYYIVMGYRDSLLFDTSVFEHMGYTIYFWALVMFLFIISTDIFRKLKPHFADVL